MSIYDQQHHFEHLACCPITRQDVRLMDGDELAAINARAEKGELAHFDGTPVEPSLAAGFITGDGSIVYPVLDDIALLLPDFAIALVPERLKNAAVPDYKVSVREFYDNVGWQPSGDGHYEDAVRYEDLRPEASEYIHNGHLRVNNYLPPRGTYLLDAGSGPIQYPGYLSWSENYDIRICMDVSLVALQLAREKLPPGRGLFLLGNIINLPLKDHVIDGIVSLHTVYHIDGDKQHAVFDELHRVLKPGGSAVVVYTWGNVSLLNRPAMWLAQARHVLTRLLKRLVGSQHPAPPPLAKPSFFYHPQSYRWFKRQAWDYDFRILCWRSISVRSTKTFFHGRWGKRLLQLVFRLEDRYPAFFAPLGQYPMFVINKK